MFTLKHNDVELKEFDDFESTYMYMLKYIDDMKFKSYYQRTWFVNDCEMKIDYGSHTSYMIICSDRPFVDDYRLFMGLSQQLNDDNNEELKVLDSNKTLTVANLHIMYNKYINTDNKEVKRRLLDSIKEQENYLLEVLKNG